MAIAYPKTVKDLADALAPANYTAKTDDEMRTTAQNMYANQRDASVLAANQQYDTTSSALQQQLKQLDTSYQRQVEQQEKNNRASIASADRYAMSRGMGRSSYNEANRANLMAAGDKALAGIAADRSNQESNIAAQQSLAAQQRQENVNAANLQYENNVLNKLNELRDQDYSRAQAANDTNNDLLFKLFQLGLTKSSSGSYKYANGNGNGNVGNSDGNADTSNGLNFPQNNRNYSYNQNWYATANNTMKKNYQVK